MKHLSIKKDIGIKYRFRAVKIELNLEPKHILLNLKRIYFKFKLKIQPKLHSLRSAYIDFPIILYSYYISTSSFKTN